MIEKYCWSRPGTAIAVACAWLVCADPARGQHPDIDEAQVLEYLTLHPDFLARHPELIHRALALKQAAIDEAEIARRRALVDAEVDGLLGSGWTPVRGDPKAAYTLIEFSDYQCTPCRRSYPAVESFVSHARNVRLVRLQLPVYGPWSTMAARAALLAQKLGDFESYHRAIMTSSGPLDLEAIEAALESAGVPADEFERRMGDPELSGHLQRVKEFSIAAKVPGTPAYLLDGILLSGAVSEEDLTAALVQREQRGD